MLCFPDFSGSLPVSPYKLFPSKSHMFNPALAVCFQRTQTNTSGALRDPQHQGKIKNVRLAHSLPGR